jgi:hypothetical protein
MRARSIRRSPVRHSPGALDEKATPTPFVPISEHYYGLLGDFVRAVEPLTEADPLGILACLLAGVGNALGRAVHHTIGRRHATNLFVLLTGATSDRKGTCWDVSQTLLSLAAPDWADGCIENGFGSGQGFIFRIRDAHGDDEGISDKRLLVCEEEWAKPMRLLRSESSILSASMRAAFDGSPLNVLNKGENRYGCREPHLSIVGMITPEELLETLKGRSEMYNGFLNRFLLIGVKRTRYLSCGADYRSVCAKYAAPLRDAMVIASAMREPFGVADEARSFWDAEYLRLEADRSGNYGKATARLSVHALKTAMLYATLDGENAIGLRHLKAALSFVAQADRTAYELFGTTTATAHSEEPPHSRLLAYARSRSDGITRTDAFRLFSNKRKAPDIDADFALLKDFGKWQGDRWFATPEGDKGGGVVNGIGVRRTANWRTEQNETPLQKENDMSLIRVCPHNFVEGQCKMCGTRDKSRAKRWDDPIEKAEREKRYNEAQLKRIGQERQRGVPEKDIHIPAHLIDKAGPRPPDLEGDEALTDEEFLRKLKEMPC